MILNPWREVLLKELRTSLKNIKEVEEVRERQGKEGNEHEMSNLALNLQRETETAFDLASYLNLISLLQESTSFIIKDGPLSSSDSKSNQTLSDRLASIKSFLEKANPEVSSSPPSFLVLAFFLLCFLTGTRGLNFFFSIFESFQSPAKIAIPPEELLVVFPGKSNPKDREIIVSVYHQIKALFQGKVTKKRKDKNSLAQINSV